MRAAAPLPALDRLRRRLRSVLADVRAAGGRRRRRELHLPVQIRARREDRLLGDEPQRVGTPTNPLDPAVVEDWADRVFYRAVASSACATPWIALNEMWGSNLATPWSPTNAQYRQNVIIFVRRLRALGAHPYLLVNSRPFTDGEAGGIRASRRPLHGLRARGLFRRAADQQAGGRSWLAHAPQRVPPGRDRPDVDRDPGLEDRHLPRLPYEPGQGGREGLKPASAWFNNIKLQVLAIKQVSREIPLATIWSWGWGEWALADRDPDKPAAACVYLWTRDHKLCNGPGMAGRGFDPNLAEGQLNLSGSVQCRTPWGNIGTGRLSSLAGVTRDREIAYTSLFARLVLKKEVKVKREELGAAERAIVRNGSAAAARRTAKRLARLGRRGTSRGESSPTSCARRRSNAASTSPALPATRSPNTSAPIRTPSARLVTSMPAPSWLGKQRRGVAIEGMAPAAVFRIPTGKTVTLVTREGTLKVRAVGPTAPLGAFALDEARSSIRAALVRISQDQVFDNWLMSRETSALQWVTCRRDWLPAVGTLELAGELPFLALAL